jgi:type IV secretion system protein VirD4
MHPQERQQGDGAAWARDRVQPRDRPEVLRLPGRRSLVLFRSDILRFPVLAFKVDYRSWRHVRWWNTYDTWPAAA